MMMQCLHRCAARLIAGVAFTFVAASADAGQTTFSITINDNNACQSWSVTGSPNAPVLVCNNGGPPPPPGAPSCTVTANGQNPLTIASAGLVALQATCSNVDATTQYAWTGPGAAASTGATASQSLTVNGTGTYGVTATSGSGAVGNTASVTVTVGAQQAGGFCSQYANVQPIVDLTWARAQDWHSVDLGGLPSNGVWVFRFTVPAGSPNSASQGRFSVSEYVGPITFRQISLSTQACDFRPKDYTGLNGPLTTQQGTTATAPFAVQTPTLFGGVAGLAAGATYYVNVRNWSTDLNGGQGGVSCSQGSCNAIMTYAPSSP